MQQLVGRIIERYPALNEPSYVTYFSGSLAAVGATQMLTFAQALLVYELTASPAMLGWLGAAIAIPNLAITLFGGVIADRYNKRLILFVTSAINMLLVGILAVLVLTDTVAAWHILLIASLSSLANGLDWPTRVSFFPQLVGPESYLSAVALSSLTWQVTALAVPAMCGLLVVLTDISVVLVIAAVGYFVMLGSMYSITIRYPTTTPTRIHALSQIREGVAFVFKNDIFKFLLILTFVGMFFCNSHHQLMPLFADLSSTYDPGFALGLLLGAGGIGSIVGTLVAGARRTDRNLAVALLNSGLLTCVMTISFVIVAHLGWFVAALICQAAAAYFGAAFMVTSMTTLQLSVPDELRGRVMGIHTMGYSLRPGGGLFLGSVTEWTNPIFAVALGSGIYAVALTVLLSLKRNLRQLRFNQLRVLGS